MAFSGQDTSGDSRSVRAAGAGSAALVYLSKAASALQGRLGHDLWTRLDKRTRSCLVTSQVFHEMLEEVAAERDKVLELTGKQLGQTEAPEIDFSPVILCLFKAVEIEVERKIFRPFRDAMSLARRMATPEAGWPSQELTSLAYFVRHGKPLPGLKFSALLFSKLKECRANEPGLLGDLKRWMQSNLLRPNRWWRDGRLCYRLQQAVDIHRNAAAHTGRLTPLEAQKAVAELWGDACRPGLIRSVLRATEGVPVPKSQTARDGEKEGAIRGEIRKGFVVNRALLLKPRFWLLDAAEQEMSDRYLLTVVPGDFGLIKSATEEFKARRQVTDEHLLPLEKWFQAEPEWGRRIVIASPLDEDTCVAQRRRKARPILSPGEGQALALALAQAVSVLHRAGWVHGFVSPYTVFRSLGNRWLLGGQALLLIARRGCPVYAYPRVVAPEVNMAGARTLEPATDVYAIAATVCCLCAAGAARNIGPPTPSDAEGLFPPGPLQAALRRALASDPSSRHVDATELLTGLTGRPAERWGATAEPYPVVISYSRKDEKEAERLTADLEAYGIRAWRDKDMISGGVQWREAIVSAIDNCRVVVFLVSKNSMESEQVPKELDIASDIHKVILPVCLDDTKIEAQFRYLLAGVHRLEFFAGDREESLKQLLRALREHGVLPTRRSGR